MKELLFHAQWWMVLAAALFGAFLFYTGNNRREFRLRNAGAAAILLAVIWGGVSWWIESDAEKVQRQTKELVSAVANKNWDKAKSLMDPNTSLKIAGGSDRPMGNRELILGLAKNAVDRYGVKSAFVSSIETQQNDSLITLTLEVWSTQDLSQDRPVSSTWQLQWQQRGDEWILQEIELLSMAGQTGSNMINPFR